jgi:streptogramin lyase
MAILLKGAVHVGRPASARGLLASVLLGLIATLIPAAGAAGAPIGTVTEYSNGISPKAEPWGIAAGPDGNVWFTENGYETTPGAIARITPSGVVTQFTSGLPEFTGPEGITDGSEGNLWFTDSTDAVGRITPAGTITEFSKGITPNSYPGAIVAGPEGNLWFTEYPGRIGRITPAGVVTEFSTGIPAEEDPDSIAVGPDGNLWFTESGHYSVPAKKYFGGAVGRITPAGVITQFSAGITPEARADGIAQGPDGNMWFTEGAGRIGRITPSGAITEFSKGITLGAELEGIATGADGNLWFAEYGGNRIGRITTSGTVTEFSTGMTESSPRSIAAGPDGNLWFAQLEASASSSPAEVGSIVSGAAPALLAAPTVSGGSVAGVPQQCSGAVWSTWAGLQPASSLFAIDGYRWMLDGAPAGAGQTYTPSTASVGHALSCSVTVTYALQDVTVSATSAAVTVLAPPSPPSKVTPPVPPVLSGARQSASTWRVGSKLASISRKRRPPVGTVFSFMLSEPASVIFTFTQRVAGRELKGRCVAMTRGNRHRRACTRRVTRGTVSLPGHAGSARVRFQGRLNSSRKLGPGSYTVTIVAVNTAGQRSRASTLHFTIVK